jgi:hypothetical protein
MNTYLNIAKKYFTLVEKDLNLIKLNSNEKKFLASFKNITINLPYMDLLLLVKKTTFKTSLFSVYVVENGSMSRLKNSSDLNLVDLANYIRRSQKTVIKTGGLYLVVIPQDQPDFFFIPTYRNDISIMFKDSLSNWNEVKKLI